MSRLAERYAAALFELAQQEDALKVYQQQCRELITIFEHEQMIRSFFAAVQIPTDEKKDFLAVAFKGKIEGMLFNFLNLLVDKKRISHVTEILKEFNTMCNDAQNIREGVVYSARPLEQKQLRQLEEAMGKKLNKEVELHNVIDQRLISGVKIAVDNQVVDVSMKNRIESLKSELLKESR